jgi:hypothetical protein
MPTVLHYIKAPVVFSLAATKAHLLADAVPLTARASREVGATLGLPGPRGLERLEKQVLIK